jgi:hypothetical protein
MIDLAILGVKILFFGGLYILRQMLFKRRIRLEHIAITLVLALYTKPVVEDVIVGWVV